MVRKPVVLGFDVASDPCFLITSFCRRTFLELTPQSFSDPTRMKVAIRDHQKGKWQRKTVFREPIESRLQSEKLNGCGPQPTLLIWPAGRTISIASFSVAETPAASITRSKPYPSRNDRVHSTMSSPLAPRVADAPICSAICNRRVSATVPMTTSSPAPASSGFRLDAAPFVIAYKGPDAAKQPHESFDYLEEFAEFLRWKTGDAILVAEANVAPDQILNYFGERGQRMTMVINFFVNPHLFLAIAEQSPEPIERALRQLPQIPILSHWAKAPSATGNLMCKLSGATPTRY
jgi:hypothetical protein